MFGHANISSLGVLHRYDGKYRDFEVLGNFSVSNYVVVKMNAATSGSSGSFRTCIMVTRNVIQEPRELAQRLRDHVEALLKDLPPVPPEVPDLSLIHI